ncbi:MAG: DUF402 domain-containing protein [Bacilli bacterium]|nr:DUF402 domain-containing protein [Bacilli bacterium]
MKRKIITNTYLREATKYQIKLFLDEKDYYVSVKKLIDVTDKFIISNNIVAMDNGYYILEIIPKKENYALRVFFNDKKEIIEYYFDIIKGSGLDEVYNVPYFDDLYLDITILNSTKEIKIIDEEELVTAYRNHDISSDDYHLVLNVKEKLLKEIRSWSNKLLKIDYQKYLKDF